MISVIVTVYNCKEYLDRCIKSIIHQSYNDIEIILVDDGSNDGSNVLCDNYSDTYSYIKTIHQSNSGCGPAKNTGLKNAKGEYIVFVDADDYIEKDMFRVMLTTLKENEADVVGCAYNRVYDEGKKEYYGNDTEKITLFNGESALENMIFGYDIIAHWGKIFKASLFNGILIKNMSGQDYESMPKIFKNVSKYVYIGTPYYNWSFNMNSITNSKLKPGWTKKYLLADRENIIYFKDNYPKMLNRVKALFIKSSFNFLYRTKDNGDDPERNELVNDVLKVVDVNVLKELDNKEKIKLLTLKIGLPLFDLCFDIKSLFKK